VIGALSALEFTSLDARVKYMAATVVLENRKRMDPRLPLGLSAFEPTRAEFGNGDDGNELPKRI
jgi:hypothetical protein